MGDQIHVERVRLALSGVHDNRAKQEAENYLLNGPADVPRFFCILHQVYSDPGSRIDDTARTLAAITFKNGIDKYWRKTAKNAIPEHDKQEIRMSILGASDPSVPAAVARQNSVAIAKIARYDFPLDWPDLFGNILQKLSASQSDEQALYRHMCTLHQVIKTLCSLRISRSRENFQRAAPELLSFVHAAYSAFANRWLSSWNTSISVETLQISDVALKMARRLVCYGFEKPYADESCRSFFSLLSSHLPLIWSTFTNLNSNTKGQESRIELVSKHLLHTGKFFLELSSNSMENYAMNYNYVLMPGSMQLVKIYWEIVVAAAASKWIDIQKVVIQGMILLKQCVKLVGLPETSIRIMKDKESLEVTESLRILETELFAPESLKSIIENLITLFFILKSEDVELWEENPEEWMLSQETSHWQFELRPCAERVFHDVFAQFKAVLIFPLFSVLESTLAAKSGHALLMKEAMYNALGIAAPHLFDDFNFDSFLDSLQAEIHDPTLATIFKRRILVLISQWVSVKCSEDKRPIVYEIVMYQLKQSEVESQDGLMLASAFIVQQVVDDWDWQLEKFEPYAPSILNSLVRCLSVAEETESRMRILTSLGLICERMEKRINSEIGVILQQIPILWNNSHGEHLLKVALLGLLSRVVLSQKELSTQCYSVVLPLIQYSTDASNMESVYLMEESFELWHAVLQNASSPDDHLLQMFPIILQPQCLPTATDDLKKILFIVESSILLLGEGILRQGLARQLVTDMISLLPGLRSDALSHFTRVLGLAAQVWGYACFTRDNLWRLTELLHDPVKDILSQTCYLCLLSQMVLSNSSQTVRFWSEYPEGDLTRPFIDKLAERFDNIGHPKFRKLCAMAVTAMTAAASSTFQDEDVLACLGSIWEDVLAEVQASGDDLVYWADDSALIEDLEAESPEIQRRKHLSEQDPVCSVRFKEFVRAHYHLVNSDFLGTNLKSLLS